MAERRDPVGGFNFTLSFVDTAGLVDTLFRVATNYRVAGFTECSGLDATMEVFEIREGGVNHFVHKFPTRATFANITLKKGIVVRVDELWKWHNSFVTGRGVRKDGVITLFNEARRLAKVWKFRRGLPVKWVGPSLNAGQSNVAIESLEIAHEGLIMDLS